MLITRRSILRGLLAAPLIVRAGSLMPIRVARTAVAPYLIPLDYEFHDPWAEYSRRILQPMIDRFAEAAAQELLMGERARADMEFFDGQRWAQGALARGTESGIGASLGGFAKPLNGRDGVMSDPAGTFVPPPITRIGRSPK